MSDDLDPDFDIPSLQSYYTGAWATGLGTFGYSDLLTVFLNGVGYQINLGYNNTYDWVCGGYNGVYSDSPHYMGFLKCQYTAGMIGGIAGAFDYPTNAGGFSASFAATNPPYWLTQMVTLSQVHAEFSYLQNFLFDGELLSGPQPHSWALDQPAYEFTNSAGDATARVLARKLDGTNEWLITAWASTGSNRYVAVEIPILGFVQVYARDCGTIYLATANNNLMVQDLADGGAIPPAPLPAPPTNFRIVANPVPVSALTPVLWWKFDEGSGTTTADSSGNGYSGTLTSAYSSGLPTWVTGPSGNGALSLEANGAVQTTGDVTQIGGQQNASISAWVFLSNAYDGISITFNGQSQFFGFKITNPYYQQISFLLGSSAGNNSSYPYFWPVPVQGKGLTGWHHIVCTYDGNQAINANMVAMYVDGTAVNASQGSQLNPTTLGSSAQLGQFFVDWYFQGGEVDDVRLYTNTLTQAQVQSLYNAGAQ
jgi:hypothetical protein